MSIARSITREIARRIDRFTVDSPGTTETAKVYPTSGGTLDTGSTSIVFAAATAGASDPANWIYTADGTPLTINAAVPAGSTIIIAHSNVTTGQTLVIRYNGAGNWTSGGTAVGAFYDFPVTNNQ